MSKSTKNTLKKSAFKNLYFLGLAFLFGTVLATIITVFAMRKIFAWRFELLEHNLQRAKTEKEARNFTIPVSEENFSPQKIFLSQVIDSQQYTVEGDDHAETQQSYFESLKLKENGQDLSGEKQEFSRILTQLVSTQTIDFWIDFKQKRIYFIDHSELENGVTDYDFVYQYSIGEFANAQDDELKIIKTIPSNLNYRTHIRGWHTSTNSLVLDIRGGEGCGGSGEITLLSLPGQLKNITSYDLGCNVTTHKRRFGGMIGNSLIIADVEPFQERSELQKIFAGKEISGELQQVYLLDLQTLKRQPLITDKNLLLGLDLSEKWLQSTLSEQTVLFTGYAKEDIEALKNDVNTEIHSKKFVYDVQKKEVSELTLD